MKSGMPDVKTISEALDQIAEAEAREWEVNEKFIGILNRHIKFLSVHKKISDMAMSEAFPENDRDLLKREDFSIVNKIEILYMTTVKECEFILNNRDTINEDGGDPLREIGIAIGIARDLHEIIFSSTEQDAVFDTWNRQRRTLIGHNSKKSEKAKEFWKLWQARFRQLRSEGFGPFQARDQILADMEKSKIKMTLKSLKTWLKD